MDDAELLHAYVDDGSEQAFTTLVERHGDLVYSTARRQVRDAQLAEEVTQRTFLLLSRKAARLRVHASLAGWLYRTACWAAADALRTERRRRIREQKAMDSPPSDAEVRWVDIEPWLERAMNHLSETDRLAILVRFFERKPMRAVGQALGVGEDAAKMRVARAVEKLRQFFARKGIISSAALLGTLLESKAVEAMPVRMVGSVCAAVAGAGAHAPLAGLVASKPLLFMTTTNLTKPALVGLILMLALTSATFLSWSHFDRSARRQTSARSRTFSARLGITAPEQDTHPAAAQEPPAVDAELVQALEGLRTALFTPPSSAHIPFERIGPALARFGTKKKMAMPMLQAALEEMNGVVQSLAARGLMELGTDAAESLPQLLRLLKANRLDLLNEDVVKLFTALHPHPDIIPELLPSLSQPQIVDRSRIAELIAALAQRVPSEAEPYRAQLVELLEQDNPDGRFYAAFTLARFPGDKQAVVTSELAKNLKLVGFQDPHYYDPIVNKEEHTTYLRDGDKLFDNVRRFEAVGSLALLGSEAKAFVPDLQTVARLSDDDQLRTQALVALGKIDPDLRQTDPAVEQVFSSAEISQRLAAQARTGHATLDELVEGLKYPESSEAAAEALDHMGAEAQPAIAALEQALKTWGTYDAARVLAKLAPDKLIEAGGDVKNPRCIGTAAQVIAEMPSVFQGAAPKLVQALEQLSPQEIGARGGLADAIKAIDPRAPKPLFGWDDLHPATIVLHQAAEAAGNSVFQKVQDLEIGQFQDLNQKTRGEVLAFADALAKLDKGVYGAFVSKLSELNPSLREALVKTH